MRHEVVYDGVPAGDGGRVHLEEGGVQQHLKALPAPRLTGVLVTTQVSQDLRARSERRQVVGAEMGEKWGCRAFV